MKNNNSKSAATKSTTKKSAAKKVVTIERNRLNQQMKIVKTVDENPRRKGTFGYKSFSKIKNGMTVEQFVEKGGRLRDLHWDLEHGYLKLRKIA